MILNFDILFQVSFKHGYFLNSKLECLSAKPTKTSLQTLTNYGLLFKQLKDGFTILFETNMAGRKRDRSALLDKGITLRFTLDLNDSYFYNYTSVFKANINDLIFYFNNTFSNNMSHDADLLHKSEFVSEENLVALETVGDNFFVKPFGVVDMEISASLREDNTIFFDKKNSYWQYIVVGDLKNSTNLSILNTYDQIAFSVSEKIKLPDKREALLFTSLVPISIKEKPDDLFQLVENYEPDSGKHKVVKRMLPVPDIKHVSSGTGKINEKKKANYSEIYIY